MVLMPEVLCSYSWANVSPREREREKGEGDMGRGREREKKTLGGEEGRKEGGKERERERENLSLLNEREREVNLVCFSYFCFKCEPGCSVFTSTRITCKPFLSALEN